MIVKETKIQCFKIKMSFFKIQFCFKRDWVTAITEERNNLKLFCTNAHNSKIKLLKIAEGIFGPFWI